MEKQAEQNILDKRLIVILLIVFVQIVGASMVLPILPLYASREFNLSASTITLLNTSFFAAQFLAGPYLGKLSDRYGRIPVLLVSQVGTVIAFLMLGFGQSVWMLFAARIFDGITGGNIIVAQAYITDISSPKQRTTALGYLFAAFGVGFIVGPAIGGILSSQFSYQTPYIFAAIAASIVVVLTYFILEETVTDEQKAENKEGKKPQLTFASVIGNTPLVGILVISFGAQLAFSMLQSTFSLFGEAVLFVDNPEQAELGIGILFAMVGVGQIVTQGFVLRRISDRFGDGGVVLTGAIIRSISMFVLVIIAVPISAGLALFLFAVGTGLQMPALQSIITNTVPVNQRGSVMGLYQSAVSLSIIVGSAIAGVLFEIDPITPYVLGGVVFAIMVIPSYYLMKWNRQQKRDEDELIPAIAHATGD
ncbi:MAG: tetracycline resistance MFS efflux pump [Phototrophicaceae bacterium]